MKTTHSTKALFVWLITIFVLLIFMLSVTIGLTQNAFVYNTINSVLGGERKYLKSGDPLEYQYYKADYANKKDTLSAANALNEEICNEGIILLKNEDQTLPLQKGKNITVFGKNSIDPVLGGSGSNAGASANLKVDVYASLQSAGFHCNPTMKAYYESSESGSGRPDSPGMGSILTGYPISEASLPYSQKVVNSYSQYNDAAIVFISRIGGEGYDLPRTMFWNGSNYKDWTGTQIIPGARSAGDHYLQLDKNETDMLNEACENFDSVIVVVNSASPIELGFLDDPSHYAYNQKIKSALWLGHPGVSGINSLGKVINGDVNPSGKTIDTFSRDFKQDPTWNNFGNNLKADGNRYMVDNQKKNAYFVEYREGVYVGYRYYETRGFTGGETWYKNNVVYPFGYGKSYTDFEWTVEIPQDAGTNLTENSEISINVKVKNIGNRAGKDVVQLYYTSPYKDGEIEKSHIVLGDFVKTDLLESQEEKTYTLKISARDMASYDYNDANHNDFKGYELDEGAYSIKIMSDAHTVKETINYNVENNIKYSNDENGKAVENLFDDVSGHIKTYLSRKNNFENYSVLLGSSEESYRKVSNDFIQSFSYKLNDTESDPWFTTNMPTQQKSPLSSQKTEVKLYDLIGKDYNDELWDTLLNQLTVTQMSALVSSGNYRTIRIDNIEKPLTTDADGPMGFAIFMGDSSVYDTCYYASECILGATWNEELAYKMGKMVGNESIIGDEDGDGRTYSGWYAPAMNIHRSQFGGRNFEYYSEDSFLSGEMAKNVVKGAKEKGVYTYAKHFALNEQETNRDTTGLVTWANEQSMREIYFKPFETCIKEGKTTALMSSFNRIGTTWAGGNYKLLTTLLRDEWGFKGMVITDFNLKTYMDVDQMLRAGGDLNLSPNKSPTSLTSATDITVLRKATKNILFAIANSNAMNGIGENVVWGYSIPWWVTWLIVADVVIFVITSVLGGFLIHQKRKKS